MMYLYDVEEKYFHRHNKIKSIEYIVGDVDVEISIETVEFYINIKSIYDSKSNRNKDIYNAWMECGDVNIIDGGKALLVFYANYGKRLNRLDDRCDESISSPCISQM